MTSVHGSQHSEDSSPDRAFFTQESKEPASPVPDGSNAENATSSGGPGGLPTPDFHDEMHSLQDLKLMQSYLNLLTQPRRSRKDAPQSQTTHR